MRIGELFETWNLTGLKVKTPILEMDWAPSDADKDAAWDLYVELLTRITTQRCPTKTASNQLPSKVFIRFFRLPEKPCNTTGAKLSGFQESR